MICYIIIFIIINNRGKYQGRNRKGKQIMTKYLNGQHL